MPRLSTDLLEQARLLARREPQRPRQASLRRSISTSYYSLFHFLIEETTALIIGTGQNRAELRQLAGRAFEHGKMKALCIEFNKPTPVALLQPFWTSLNIPANADIRKVADHFHQLQELRHNADYDLSLSFTRVSALDAADLADEARQAWDRVKHNQPALAKFFATTLLLWPSLSGRR